MMRALQPGQTTICRPGQRNIGQDLLSERWGQFISYNWSTKSALCAAHRTMGHLISELLKTVKMQKQQHHRKQILHGDLKRRRVVTVLIQQKSKQTSALSLRLLSSLDFAITKSMLSSLSSALAPSTSWAFLVLLTSLNTITKQKQNRCGSEY